ncbi:MAG: GNAT family N-acetyltransferase [Chloroflexi bacterium]|nr:GNAT family N-acetyltransferase [Chloroflexota bacterium]
MIIYRRATPTDDFTTFTIFRKSLEDFSQRTGVQAITGANDPLKKESLWESRRPFWEHLSRTSDNYWLAEKDGDVIGYARSILRGDHRELTEFFVAPGNQSAGVGRELLQRAFPKDAPHRSIIATPDLRAQARYLKAGVYPFLTELYFERAPEPVTVKTDLVIETPDAATAPIAIISDIDLEIIGHRRDVDHEFLMSDRKLNIYKRGDKVVGYGYIQRDLYGPFALLDNKDFPAVLAHAENESYVMGAAAVGFEAPTVNTAAIDYLLNRGYRLEGFMGSIMSEEPFGKFENYLLSSPPYFL